MVPQVRGRLRRWGTVDWLTGNTTLDWTALVDVFHAALYLIMLFLIWWWVVVLSWVYWHARHGTQAAVESLGEMPTQGGGPQVGSTLNFVLVIPALNEAVVIGNTVRAWLAETPPEGCRVRVFAVNDGSDDNTGAILDAIDDPRLTVLHRRPPEARLGKGQALNAAYQAILVDARQRGTEKSTVLGVLDADSRPGPDVLREVHDFFADVSVDAVQTGVRIRNRDRFWGRVQNLEFGSLVDAQQTYRDVDEAVYLAGNGQFVTLSALTGLGGRPWSHSLVEDLDLGVRLLLNEDRIRYTSRTFVSQQGLTQVKPLMRQRTRWVQGNLMALPFIPAAKRSRVFTRRTMIDLTLYLMTPAITIPGLLLVIFSWAYFAQRALTHSIPGFWFSMTLIAAVTPIVILSHGHRRRNPQIGRPEAVGSALGFMVLVLIGAVVTWRAAVRILRKQHGWSKTARLAEPDDVPAIPTASM